MFRPWRQRCQGIQWPQWWALPSLIFMGSLAFLSAVALIFKNDDADADLYRSSEPAASGRLAAAGQRIEPVFGTSDYRAAGLPENFVQRVGATPASNMWFPTPQELQAANVVTRVCAGQR